MSDAIPDRHVSLYADHPSIGPVLPQFVARLPGHVQKLRGFYAQGKGEELRRLLHKLKGAGASYGFPPISEWSLAMETHLLSGKPLAELEPALERLIGYIERVEGYPPSLPSNGAHGSQIAL